MPRRTADASAATRVQLIEAGRQVFTEKGFVAASTSEIVARADLTRGALYHHFAGKDDLFRAVFATLEGELLERSATAADRGTDPVAQIKLVFDAFLEACTEPDVAHIVLLDGLSVVGWGAWVDHRYAFGLIVACVQAAADAGQIEPQPPEPLAHLLLGALTQAGMVVARAEAPERARAEMGTALGRLVDGLELPRARNTKASGGRRRKVWS